MSDDGDLREERSGPEGVVVVGREREHDEIVARALSFPGARTVAIDDLADVPLVDIGSGGRAPLIAAGPRTARTAAASLGSAATGRHNWVPIGPRNVAGRVRALACADPTASPPLTWYAASAGGGVWKTENGGRRWRPLWHAEPCLEIGALAVAPTRPQRIYAATGEAVPASHIAVRGFGVFVSDDSGVTWDNHGAGSANPVHRMGFEAIAVDPADPDHCWVVGIDGAFRTINAGVNWAPFQADVHFTDVQFAGARLFLVRGRSTNGEAAVIRLSTPKTAVDADLTAAANTSRVIAPRPANRAWPAAGKLAVAADNATAYVRFVAEDDRHLGIFRTTNANAGSATAINWTRLRDHPQFRDEGQGTYDLCIAVDPNNPARVATGMLYVHVSLNATAGPQAVRWRRVMSWELHDEGLRGHHADQHHLVIAGNPAELWVADDGGVARSANWATAGTIDHGRPFRPDPVRPLPPQCVTWQRRDTGISGAQPYDLGQSRLVSSAIAVGLQDNGTYMRTGGLTWRPIFGADGGFAVFDPDDPYRLEISYYAGLAALQFPALLDRLFADGARDDDAISFRFLEEGLLIGDSSPFVPELARHPNRTGRAMVAREGRLYGLRAGSGERLNVEPLGTSFELRCFTPPVGAAHPPTILVINDTPGARAIGLVPGTYNHDEFNPPDQIPGTFTLVRRTAVTLHSRLRAPFTMAEGDQVSGTLNGTAFTATFNAANGVAVAAVTIADVRRLLLAALPADRAEVHPYVWDAPVGVYLITRSSGAASSIALGGTAFDPLPADGLSRLAVNRGTYRGDAGRPASVLIGYVGSRETDRRVNRDFSAGPVPDITVAIDGGAASPPIQIQAPAFPDRANVTPAQLAAALRAALPATVDVVAAPVVPRVVLRPTRGFRAVCTGTAAVRLGLSPRGARSIRLGTPNLVSRHGNRHRRNFGSVDLTPDAVGTPLRLVISDGTNATAPLEFTEGVGGNVAALRSVTVEELHRAISGHLAAHPAVRVRSELSVLMLPGAVSELRFSPADDQVVWAGLPDGSVYVSTDDGATWQDVTDARMRQGGRQVEAIALHPTDRRTAWVALSGEPAVVGDPGFVFATASLGANWNPVGHTVTGATATGIVAAGVPIGVNALDCDPKTPQHLYAATDAGVFRSVDTAATWQPFGEGLPNAPVTDLLVEPNDQVVRAALWTRGVYERRIDTAGPDDTRLVVRASELDDGRRPIRSAPSFGTSAPEPVRVASPDIKVVRRRGDIGADVDLDGATFDLEVGSDDVVPGTAAQVFVQVANMGGVTLASPPAPPALPPARVVVLSAPAGAGPPPLPAEVWMRLAAGPLPNPLGAWTVIGDGPVPRPIGSGDTALVSFNANWPAALTGAGTVGLLAIVTSWNDPLTAGPTDVARLVATERRVAYREVPVVLADDDRTIVLRSTDGRDILVEQPPAAAGTGVADRLGFALPTIAATVQQSSPAAGADYALATAPAPGPAIVVRSAAAIVADLPLLPVGAEAEDPAEADAEETARVINRLAAAQAIPIEAYEIPVGVGILGRADVQVRFSGPAQAPLNLPAGAVFTAFAESTPRATTFNLTGAASLTITVQIPGQANVAVNVELAAENFDDVTAADPNTIARNIRDALANADLGDVVTAFARNGLAIRGRGQATLVVGGPAAAPAVLGLAVNADNVAVSTMDTADLTAGPVLHVEVTPRVVVRFDGDPADIPDLAHATPFDVRRAINLACELASVPVRAEVPRIRLRVAASPADIAGPHPVTGGRHLAELAASSTPVAAGADQEKLFEERTALGVDVVETGVNGFLYLRVTNVGNVPCPAARLRLIRIDPATTPLGRTDIATATVALPIAPGASHIEQFRWDPGGSAPRVELVLVIADEDRADHRVDPPAQFQTAEELEAFVAAHPGVALRTFQVRDP